VTDTRYRSFIVRVRRRDDAAVRLDVEDLLDGQRRSLTGDDARTLAADLEASVDGREREQPETAATGDEPAARDAADGA